MKRIIINVDDLGLSEAVNGAVLALAQAKKISSASLMSLGKINKEVAVELHEYGIDLGLHLDFTSILFQKAYPYATFSQPTTLTKLIGAAWLRCLDKVWIRSAIEQQLDYFEKSIGRPPVFIDGHQHVHQFPQIREQLGAVIQERYSNNALAIRSTRPLSFNVKAQMIYALGGSALDNRCQKEKYVQNKVLAGVYDFQHFSKLPHYWAQWLTQLPVAGGVIMCHPALSGFEWQDDIRFAREAEYRWLMSPLFDTLLEKNHVQIVNWSSVIRFSP